MCVRMWFLFICVCLFGLLRVQPFVCVCTWVLMLMSNLMLLLPLTVSWPFVVFVGIPNQNKRCHVGEMVALFRFVDRQILPGARDAGGPRDFSTKTRPKNPVRNQNLGSHPANSFI